MVNDTACKDCPFKKMGMSECPNYIETFWHEKNNPQPKLVKDCAPKRTLLMLQEMYTRMFGIQQQINQAENAILGFKATMDHFGEFTRMMEAEQYKKVDYNDSTL